MQDIREDVLGSEFFPEQTVAWDYTSYSLDSNLPTSPWFKPAPTKAPTTTLGDLDVLPTELLWQILPQLDLKTLRLFRHVNHRATDVVHSMPEYQIISKYAPSAFEGAVLIGSASFVTCQALCKTLYSGKCEDCDDFGKYLYMITCKRVCYNCATSNWEYEPLRRSHAIFRFGLDPASVKELPQMRCIPGQYANKPHSLSDKTLLIDARSAYRAGIAQHGSRKKMKEYTAAQEKQREEENERARARYRETLQSHPQAFNPRPRLQATAETRTAYRESFRFASLVTTPWIDLKAKKLEWGFRCRHCNPRGPIRAIASTRRRLFTDYSFEHHLLEEHPDEELDEDWD